MYFLVLRIYKQKSLVQNSLEVYKLIGFWFLVFERSINNFFICVEPEHNGTIFSVWRIIRSNLSRICANSNNNLAVQTITRAIRDAGRSFEWKIVENINLCFVHITPALSQTNYHFVCLWIKNKRYGLCQWAFIFNLMFL